MGIIWVAAKRLKVSRRTLQRFMRKHPQLEDDRQEAIEKMGDLAESKLINLLNAGDTGGVTGMGFLGVESSTTIASVIIHDTGATFRVDNLRYDSVAPMPEPDAALLFCAGLVAASFGVRRRHSLS